MVVELAAQGFVSRFPKSMRREVEGNGKCFVVVDEGAKPLLSL